MKKKALLVSLMLVFALFLGANAVFAGCYMKDDGAVYMEYGKPVSTKVDKAKSCAKKEPALQNCNYVSKCDCKCGCGKDAECKCEKCKCECGCGKGIECTCKNCDCKCKKQEMGCKVEKPKDCCKKSKNKKWYYLYLR